MKSIYAIIAFAVTAQSALAGYDIRMNQVTFQFLSSDNVPLQNLSYELYLGTTVERFRWFGCDGHESLPLPGFCRERYDLLGTFSAGLALLTDQNGLIELPGFSFSNTSGDYQDVVFTGRIHGFLSDKCEKGGVYAFGFDKTGLEPGWNSVLSEKEAPFSFRCQLDARMYGSGKFEIDFGGRALLVCQFPVTYSQIQDVIAQSIPGECWR